MQDVDTNTTPSIAGGSNKSSPRATGASSPKKGVSFDALFQGTGV
jgi:hypothetical protein